MNELIIHKFIIPFPIVFVIREGRSSWGNSLARRSSTEEMEEDLLRRGEEGGVEQELSPELASSLIGMRRCPGEFSLLDKGDLRSSKHVSK